ncbi:hypothetical protein [Oligoflexus tunisiensis]|uniref:hypothetical protein n=1 Tax=Oligoflexus tunisiensis TaxID=708132 RepID=UPI00114C8A2F|nr:hypothetical protein [Oligoflexus tunisiensis]
MTRILLGPLLVLCACKTTQPSTVRQAPVKPSALIGTAYDAHTQEFTGMSCLDVSSLNADDYEMTTQGELRTEMKDAVTAAELESIFGFFQKSFFAPATGLRLSRPFEAIQRILAGERDVAKVLLVQGPRGTLRFHPASRAKLQLTPEAQKLAQNILAAGDTDRARHVNAFVQTCGTGFLSGTSYTLGMAAVLRWIYKSPEDKQRLGPQVLALDVDANTDDSIALGAVRLRYEIFLKESRDINARLLNEGHRDCSPDAPAPCLDAFRLFKNATIPAWEKRLKKLTRHFDWTLPQAFLSQPEIIAYHEVEPALAGIALEPAAADAKAWSEARGRFVELYVKALRMMQDKERQPPASHEPGSRLQDLLQQISQGAAPCYRPRLDRELCQQEAQRLETAGMPGKNVD